MTDTRYGAGDSGPGDVTPGPSSFPADSPVSDLGAPPTAAAAVFGERLPLAGRYAKILATEGVVRGLIGPRETPRLWERHLVNCGVMADMIPVGASVIDVGSGAGLPGLVLAVARPDLAITLVEPLARRTAFLEEVVVALGLDNVTVVRGRAEEVVGRLPEAEVVTARAVAALDKLAGWCLPLAAVGGRLLAMKGSSAAEEIVEHAAAVGKLGGAAARIELCGTGLIDPPTTVVEIVKERHVTPARGGSSRNVGTGGAKSRGRGNRPRRG